MKTDDLAGLIDNEAHLTLRIRNNRLRKTRVQMGWTQRHLAKKAGVSTPFVGGLETLRVSPRDKTRKGGSKCGEAGRTADSFKPSALAVARALGRDPEYLFPAWLYEVQTPYAERELGESELRLLSSPGEFTGVERQLEELLDGERDRLLLEGVDQFLTPREARVIRLRFGIGPDDGSTDGTDYRGVLLGRGERTLEEAGEVMGVSRERVRQIEAKALRKLRDLWESEDDLGDDFATLKIRIARERREREESRAPEEMWWRH